MKTLYLLLLLGAAISTAAALPPLGSAVAAGAGTDLEDEVQEDYYADLDDVLVEGDNDTSSNTTDSTDTTTEDSTGNSTVTTEEPTSNSTEITDSSNSTAPDTTSTEDHNGGGNTDDDGLSGGAIAGIVIGSIAGVALIAGGVYYMMKKEMLCFG